MPSRDHDIDALRATYDTQAAVLGGLEEVDFARPTRCKGWAVADVVLHLLLDAQRALIVLASPVPAAADTDAAGYWRDVGLPGDRRCAGPRPLRTRLGGRLSPPIGARSAVA